MFEKLLSLKKANSKPTRADTNPNAVLKNLIPDKVKDKRAGAIIEKVVFTYKINILIIILTNN